ncbi:hypothetical protein [Stenotrophomonas phage BUCTxx99]|nr:hypothetical protein [Stenotrophomonas phage BUCTxx99]
MKIGNATYDDFMEHAEATDSVVTREGNISYAKGDYLGKECQIAEFDHDTNELTLHCI